ncbi:MAG TPA: hypothetical protein VMS89_00460 [Methanoregulaceae archaeon]|nr:hypothetical protein [Methanoregulaceae archaeon]
MGYEKDDKIHGDLMNQTQQNNDKLASWWNLGIGIAYAFLVFFLIWVGYRVFLMYNAYQAGDIGFIQTELLGYVVFCAIYFGIGFILRMKKIL